MNKIIPYKNTICINNLSTLPHGTGTRFLECIYAPDNITLIAKQWRHKAPVDFCVLVDFKK